MRFSVASDCLSPPGTSASGKKGAEEASPSHLLSPLLAHQIAAWRHRGGWPRQTSRIYLDLWRYKQDKKEATISIVSWYLLQKPKPRFLWYCCYVMLSSGCRLGCPQEALAKSPCTPILKLFWEYNDEGYKGRKLSNNFKIKQMLKCRVFHIIAFYLFLNESIPGGIHQSVLQKKRKGNCFKTRDPGNVSFYPWLSLNDLI